ncbi:exonuclease SbcCD subunit D [Ruminococcaceae bacterium OttesenSCG-928-I18]|nr:exonuclease SbcCD subunit D [Ruminococcaceae bacterium OttesenSCG-928-I18]
MRFFHLADLHIGKNVAGFSLLEDQRHILHQVAALVKEYTPKAVVLAGDIYDRTSPPAEAVRLYDSFLTELAGQKTAVLAIAGNHDSPERLGFAGRLLQDSQVYSYGPFTGQAQVVTLEEDGLLVDFHLLPFLRPATVRPFFPEENVESYLDAVRLALSARPVTPGRPSVLVAHQFVTARGQTPQRSDSEVSSVGGLDEVDAGLFDAFSYVALGHIHAPQRMGRQTVRYAGSPLKYSFSEKNHQKSLCMVDVQEGKVEITALPLTPLRDMREIGGPLDALLREEVAKEQNAEDYLRVVLTDELEAPDAMGRLRHLYPNVMEVVYENTRSRTQAGFPLLEERRQKSAQELFEEFYLTQNGLPLDSTQQELLQGLLREGEVRL